MTSGGAKFLNHGKHLWDTSFDVMGTFSTKTENINALEALADDDCIGDCTPPVPEPSSKIGILALGILGGGVTLKRKLKSANSTEK